MKIKSSILKLALLGLIGSSALSFAAEQSLDSTAAVVNTGIVLESELNDKTAQVIRNYKSQGAHVDDLTARRQALESLINRSLILQLAKLNGRTVTDMELDNILKQTAVRNNTSTSAILKSYGANLTEAQAREKFKDDFIVNEVRRSSVHRRINVSENEILTLAKTLKDKGNVEPMYHLAQVIIPLSTNPSESEYRRAQANAQQAIRDIRNGANVVEIAAKYSSSDQSNDLGYVPETAVPLPFLPAVVKAKPGDVIGPFRSSVGMHILKVFDVSNNAITPVKTYRASHILIKTSIIFSDEAAIAKLNTILGDIREGRMTFAQAAKKYSEDPASAVHGGDLGYQPAETYDPNFAESLRSLQVGQYSEPVKSAYGWHLIYLQDIKIDKDSLDAYKEKARAIIMEREFAEALSSWERELRESAYIHVMDPKLISAGMSSQMDNDKNGPRKANTQKNSQGSIYMN